jgi:hypothetical protein
LLALIAFLGSFAMVAVMLLIGAALPSFARADLDAGEHVQQFGPLLVIISAILGFVFAICVYRGIRRRLSHRFIFHGCFHLGFVLLAYALWAILTQFTILDSPMLVNDFSIRGVQPALSGPVLCLVIIPVALFFLAFATAYDNNRNS